MRPFWLSLIPASTSAIVAIIRRATGFDAGLFVWGLQGAIFDSLSSSHHFYSPDFGVVLGFGAHMIIGVFILLIANFMIKIEKRLEKIENDQGQHSHEKQK
jgi:hypothetical protein